MKIKQTESSSREEESKVYKGELWKGDFFVWLNKNFTWQKSKKQVSLRAEKNVFRLISEGAFFVEAYIDVSLDFSPEIDQKIKIKGSEGVYLIIRKSNQLREFELLKKEEGLEYISDTIAGDFLKEKYTYLMAPSDLAYHSGLILEVVEIQNIKN